MSTEHKKEDLTGRTRFARNVVFGWGGQFVRIVAGFIIPRLIGDRLGQTSLGIWDFSWSIVGYFALLQLGLSGSINRYVARYRSLSDKSGLTRAVSTTDAFLKLSGVLIAAATVVTVLWIIPGFRAQLGDGLSDARWIILFLGLDLAVAAATSLSVGIVVGCHRSDLHNTLLAIYNVLTMSGMFLALLSGGGLVSLAATQFICSASVNIARIWVARRVCPELLVDWKTARWGTFLEQLHFSGKNIVPYVAQLAFNQTASVIIAGFLGPASLAIFARPRSLMNNVRVLAARFAMPLMPTASSLQARDEYAVLGKTLLSSTAALSYAVLPGVIILVVFGNDIIRLWMGPEFVRPWLFETIALGYWASLVQEPSWNILVGLNRHGRVSLVQLAGAVVGGLVLYVTIAIFHGGLVAAAIAIAVPLTIVDGVLTPWFACRRTHATLLEFYRKTFVQPVACALPFACCLLLARQLAPAKPALGYALAVVGLVVLAVVYWRFVLPDQMRLKIAKICRLPRREEKAAVTESENALVSPK